MNNPVHCGYSLSSLAMMWTTTDTSETNRHTHIDTVSNVESRDSDFEST